MQPMWRKSAKKIGGALCHEKTYENRHEKKYFRNSRFLENPHNNVGRKKYGRVARGRFA